MALSQTNTQLEQFLILAKNTTGKATVAVIMQVRKSCSVFCSNACKIAVNVSM